ncbi:hypothetical protein SAMN02799636_04320 [Methylobacterium sp. 275MFSha3.1]|uniref:hypothetical protein n=1 Tax=Methylobacterium sp. 275MFSha3.1 TaxID=1502746 RepID=UPI0008A76CFF|nr:hypothetical protein [Methylobacterium sp. 275MFSha3.1]SEH89272.1 hypothetical protein SAMN02799636_04320 [Methylobacterium sp. 275MFSha3.1]
MTISDADLETLTAYILDLEAQCAFLLQERDMYRQGPAAAQAQAKAALDACPPGYVRGNAGQLVLVDHERIYAMLAEMNPPIVRKRAKRPDGEMF